MSLQDLFSAWITFCISIWLDPILSSSDPVEAKHFSANIIVEGTPRAVKSRRQKFTKDDLDNLQSVINRRRVAAGYYSARGEQYPGHNYWLMLVMRKHGQLGEDRQSRPTSVWERRRQPPTPPRLETVLDELQLHAEAHLPSTSAIRSSPRVSWRRRVGLLKFGPNNYSGPKINLVVVSARKRGGFPGAALKNFQSYLFRLYGISCDGSGLAENHQKISR